MTKKPPIDNGHAGAADVDDPPTPVKRPPPVPEPTDPNCAAFCRIGGYIAMSLANVGSRVNELVDEVRKTNKMPTDAVYPKMIDAMAEGALTLNRGIYAMDESRDRRKAPRLPHVSRRRSDHH